MRKILIVVISMLVPFGLWTAGCRQERDTAFPNTPEMKNLARAPERNNPTRPPVIPAAPIDRDILNLPEHTTMASMNNGGGNSTSFVNAVNDRSNSLAGSRVNPNLFSMPEENGYMAMAPAAVENWEPYEVSHEPAAMTPIPSAREFWSKPAAPLRTNRQVDVPHGVSAIMPAAPAESYLPPPVPVAAPAIPSYPALPLEEIPGVFIDSGEYMGGGAGTQQPTQSGWIGMGPDNGDALGAPPLLSSASFESVPAGELGVMLREDKKTEENKGPIKLDLGGLLHSMRTIADTMVPPQEQPAQASATADLAGRSDRWKPAEKWSSALPIPASSREQETPLQLPALSTMDELRDALSPLPDITAVARSLEKKSESRAAPVTMPAPMPESVSSQEMAAAKLALLDYVPEAREDDAKALSMSNRDFFRTDFWDHKPGADAPTAAISEPQPVKIPETRPERKPDRAESQSVAPNLPVPSFEIPELKFESASKSVDKTPEAKPETKLMEEPQKVRLQPLRQSRLRPASDISDIDSAVAVPPLKF